MSTISQIRPSRKWLASTLILAVFASYLTLSNSAMTSTLWFASGAVDFSCLMLTGAGVRGAGRLDISEWGRFSMVASPDCPDHSDPRHFLGRSLPDHLLLLWPCRLCLHVGHSC